MEADVSYHGARIAIDHGSRQPLLHIGLGMDLLRLAANGLLRKGASSGIIHPNNR